MSEFLDLAGLTRYDAAIKARAGAKLTISGRTIKLVAMNGTAELASIDVPETSVPKATAQADGLLSKEDFAKLEGIAAGATKVAESATNGHISINDRDVSVYVPETFTAHENGLYKVTVDAQGRVTVATAVAKKDITDLGIPTQDTTYELATAAKDGLLAKGDFSKLQGIADGAQVNVIERVSVNGAQLPITSKGVNVDLSAYALKNDIVGAYRFKGSVAFAQLPAISGEGVTPPKAGDVYNVTDAFLLDGKNYPAGTNVAFVAASGEGSTTVAAHWDALGGEGVTATAISNTQIDALFS